MILNNEKSIFGVKSMIIKYYVKCFGYYLLLLQDAAFVPLSFDLFSKYLNSLKIKLNCKTTHLLVVKTLIKHFKPLVAYTKTSTLLPFCYYLDKEK